MCVIPPSALLSLRDDRYASPIERLNISLAQVVPSIFGGFANAQQVFSHGYSRAISFWSVTVLALTAHALL